MLNFHSTLSQTRRRLRLLAAPRAGNLLLHTIQVKQRVIYHIPPPIASKNSDLMHPILMRMPCAQHLRASGAMCGGARRSGGGTMGGTGGTGETSGTLSAPVVPMKREARRGCALAPREGCALAPRRERALPPGGRHSCPQEGDAHPPRVETHIPPGWRRSYPQVVFAHTQRAQELPDVV